MIYKAITLFILCFWMLNKSYCQDTTIKKNSKEEQLRQIRIITDRESKARDSVGIAVSKNKFDSLIVTYSRIKVNRVNKLLHKDFIIIVRLANTVSSKDGFNGSPYYKFYEFYKKYYFNLAVRKLGAGIYKGMCFYSSQYDIFIGGTMRPHKNSLYFIED